MSKKMNANGTPWRALAVVAACSIFAVGCTKKELIASQLSSPASRNADLEDSLVVMDQHPEYLADVYAAVKRHPKTLAAMLSIATADLNDPAMAELVAGQVGEHPEVLERIVRDAMDVAIKSPRARAAIDKAVGERADAAVEMLADEPTIMGALVKAALRVIEKRPAAHDAVMRALREMAPELVIMVMKNPETMKAFVTAAIHEATANHAVIKDLLQGLGCQ